MVSIITGVTKKPTASEQLKKFFLSNPNFDGYLYIGYPIIGTAEGAYHIDALWLSKAKGLVVFNLVEDKKITDYQDLQDDCANKIEAKLKGYKNIVQKRQLAVKINVITFAPFIKSNSVEEYNEEYPLSTDNESLRYFIDKISFENKQYYETLVSILQAISTIRKGRKKREAHIEESKGSKLKNLEDSIANLDNTQSEAVIETVEGVQRIRGLAGSGKTIVLALKAAYLHAQHPEWKIAITFNTRSLKEQFKRLINAFYIEQTNDEPNWENLMIMHAWGAAGGGEKNGIYYTFCSKNNIEYNDYITAKNVYGSEDPFGEICKKALDETKGNFNEIFDVILIDEAQDFSPSFLRMCYEMLRTPKRLVYAYDELQNLRVKSLPSPEEIFGKFPDGNPKVKFYESDDGRPQQDIILQKCYRNSRPVLVTAHALGFGIYRKVDNNLGTGLVQIFENSSLWQDVGYKIESGELEDGKKVSLIRNNDTSPVFLENHSDFDDLIQFKNFNDQNEQDIWVAEQIEKNIRNDELREDDIIVINPDPLTTRKAVASIRDILFKKGINSHVVGIDTTPDVFLLENSSSIAFSGIHRAKGNEAAMVYIINAQTCYDSLFDFDLAKKRNQLFTAITRSKAWVRVVGIGANMDKLISEYEQVKQHNFSLEFVYPNKKQRERLNIINRDMSNAEKNKLRKSIKSIDNLVKDIENGSVLIEDLGEDLISKLKTLIDKSK